MCFYFLYNYVWNIFHSKKNSAYIIINVHYSACKFPVILLYINENWIFLTDCLKVLKY
jgi:hypothetical protein